MIVLGLTGNYGCGKSSALEIFRELGAFTLSADALVAGLLCEAPVIGKARKIFGNEVMLPDGGLDKKKIARIVFADNAKRGALEDLLHPLVLERIRSALRTGRASVAVVEVPLLFECKMEHGFNHIAVVTAGRDVATKRLLAKGVSVRDIRARLKAQTPEIDKVRGADFVIVNRSDRDELRRQVFDIMGRLTAHQYKAGPVIYGLDLVDRKARGLVVSIGNFDGVHVGHQRIMRTAVDEARALGTGVMALTFDPHPVKVLAPERDLRLMCTPEDRAALLTRMGADRVLFIPFTREFAAMDAEEFIEVVLVGRLGVRGVVVGHGYTFGRGRKGNTALLRRRGAKLGFRVRVVRSVTMHGDTASSSRVRSLLNRGRVCEAATMLGRPYSIHGTVVKGAGRGSRILGIPTANIDSVNELVPKKGVYAVRAEVSGRLYDAVANIGDNPTFPGAVPSYEVHLFDFEGDLLGAQLRMHMIDRIRDERKFPSPEALKHQILADIQKAKDILRLKGQRPCSAFDEPEAGHKK